MTVGNQPSQAVLNQQLSQWITTIRNDMQGVANWAEYVVSLGTSGLEGLEFTSADAATMVQLAEYFLTIAGVFEGTATQASEFNFANAFSPYTGGS